MRIKVATTAELAPGGMKFVLAGGREVVVCNCDGQFFAVDRRCGHMSGPLELGTLDGRYVTCPMHQVQFDVTTGEALSPPVPVHIDEPLPTKWSEYMGHFGYLMQHTSVCNLKTFVVIVQGADVLLDL
jgi:nitrite reductase/ring-hydroxylating ferredoxin subunit